MIASPQRRAPPTAATGRPAAHYDVAARRRVYPGVAAVAAAACPQLGLAADHFHAQVVERDDQGIGRGVVGGGLPVMPAVNTRADRKWVANPCCDDVHPVPQPPGLFVKRLEDSLRHRRSVRY